MDDPAPGLILSVDTSLPQMSVALTSPDLVLGAVSLEGRESRNQKLLPAVDWLLAESGCDRGSIDLFAVTRGPGSFTGVRIGLATVQGLAMALRRPVCAMSTHEAAAYGSGSAAVVYGDAGRGEYYASVFRNGLEELAPTLIDGKRLDGLRESTGRSIDVTAQSLIANIALLAGHRAREIARSDLLERYSDLTPIYVRLAEAEVKLAQRTS